METDRENKATHVTTTCGETACPCQLRDVVLSAFNAHHAPTDSRPCSRSGSFQICSRQRLRAPKKTRSPKSQNKKQSEPNAPVGVPGSNSRTALHQTPRSAFRSRSRHPASNVSAGKAQKSVSSPNEPKPLSTSADSSVPQPKASARGKQILPNEPKPLLKTLPNPLPHRLRVARPLGRAWKLIFAKRTQARTQARSGPGPVGLFSITTIAVTAGKTNFAKRTQAAPGPDVRRNLFTANRHSAPMSPLRALAPRSVSAGKTKSAKRTQCPLQGRWRQATVENTTQSPFHRLRATPPGGPSACGEPLNGATR
jgi:hypothetical protein